VGNPSLRSLVGLENLVSAGNLSIICNDSLRNLTGIDHLDPDSVIGLVISNNPSLSTCNNQFVCDFLKDHSAVISYNAPGCNSLEEVVDACSFGVEEMSVGGQQLAVSSYPNPTDGISHFSFHISQYQWVSLKIYNAHGQEVAMVLDEKLPAGEHTVSWDASTLTAGIYFYRLTTNDRRLTTYTGKIVKY
jgi:hypothetical protein